MAIISRDPWWREWLDAIFWACLRGSRLRSGPVWFEVAGHCYYLSPGGTLYRISPGHGYGPYEDPVIQVLQRFR